MFVYIQSIKRSIDRMFWVCGCFGVDNKKYIRCDKHETLATLWAFGERILAGGWSRRGFILAVMHERWSLCSDHPNRYLVSLISLHCFMFLHLLQSLHWRCNLIRLLNHASIARCSEASCSWLAHMSLWVRSIPLAGKSAGPQRLYPCLGTESIEIHWPDHGRSQSWMDTPCWGMTRRLAVTCGWYQHPFPPWCGVQLITPNALPLAAVLRNKFASTEFMLWYFYRCFFLVALTFLVFVCDSCTLVSHHTTVTSSAN